ncbi:MAG TPA: hypothetical protein H9702_08570 [Candidatus Merdibacter merdavium]|uniref:Uncharacterized protein n=1 Tax=Candidatus Merdibacter merdavium TaxID=2838692 RepID=A0A9D2NSL4_9FIRM|nr:hypothetical protein [Candidatus Merdibacter merdavium]
MRFLFFVKLSCAEDVLVSIGRRALYVAAALEVRSYRKGSLPQKAAASFMNRFANHL